MCIKCKFSKVNGSWIVCDKLFLECEKDSTAVNEDDICNEFVEVELDALDRYFQGR